MDKRKCSEFVDNQDNLSARMKTNTQYGDNDLPSWLIDHLKPQKGEHVLDIGCGNGSYLRQVAAIIKKDNYCFGIDYDREMIHKAEEGSKNSKPAITFATMDMDTIGDPSSPFKDNFFDLIYSVYAFYYSKNEMKTLGHLKEKLKPEGRIGIMGPHGDNNKDWFVFLYKFMKLSQAVVRSSTTFMDDITSYARKNFKHVQTYEFVNNITIPSYEDMKMYWKSNIYYDPQYDPGFEKYARQHFTKHKTFTYYKKAKLTIMQGKKFG